MNNAVTYLTLRFFSNFLGFVRHWYKDGFIKIIEKTVKVLEAADRTLALKITLINFFKPLYQDYTIPGFIFGFFFRSLRVIIAIVAYGAVIAAAAAIFVAWALLPVYIIISGFRGRF